VSAEELTSAADSAGAVLRAVGRRAWPAAIVFAVTLLAAFGVSRLGASRYDATAQILLQQTDQVNAVLNPDAITSAANAQREVNTNAQLITSVPVLDAVRRQLRLHETARELAARLSVSGEATSNLVEISAEDTDPRRAAEVATAVAKQYQTYRRKSAQAAIGSAVDAAAARLQGMDAAARGSAARRRVEAFDALAVKLRSRHGSGRVVMVAAPAPYVHDDVAIRLTEALADLEPRVLLIDADLRHEGAAVEELADCGGLTSVLLSRTSLEDELVLASYRQDDDDPLPVRAWEFLPAGSGASRPTALLGGHDMTSLLASVRRRAEIVLVAAPAFGSGADAIVLAPLCDEIVLVVRERSATREQADRTRRALDGIDTPVTGIVLETGTPSRPWPLARRRRRPVLRRERRRTQDEAPRATAVRV
jgi:Mrp family chromosome partitioning ATPase